MASMYYKFTSEFTINRFISEGGKDGEHGRMENKAEFHDERKLIFILVRSIFVCVYETRWITDLKKENTLNENRSLPPS